ncbi:MAG: tetratricopeptide repeat protein [Thermoflexibacter sp.]|nr:tetratricopeptide repeat protein [Thermoflexibacter sp.]
MKREHYLLLGLVIIVFAVMSPALNNEFVNWDDEVYITKNEVIKQVPFSNLEDIFTKKINGFSVPFTLLSFQIEHYLFGLNPLPYHLANLLLHLLNVVLVYFFVKKLALGSNYLALFVALLFGIHPMNVESVAWVTERKDLLYSLFALLSINYYQSLSSYDKRLFNDKRYWLSLLFFAFSLLSKPQAIFLPMILLLIDYVRDIPSNNTTFSIQDLKKFLLKHLFYKIPYLAISISTGLYLVFNVGAKVSDKTQDYSFLEKLIFSFYQVGLYLTKLFFPFYLNNFYEYPLKNGDFYPIIFYITPLILIGLAILFFWKFRNNKIVVFGLLFYFFNIFIFLQVFSVNTAIAYERFNYLAYIGLFLIIISYLQQIKFNDILKIGAFAYLLLLGFLSFQRCKIWQNNITLFADMAKKNPNDIDANKIALKNLGDEYMTKKQYTEAIEKYTQSLSKDPLYEQAYLGRAYTFFITQRYREAITDYNKALTLPNMTQENVLQILFNRGTSLMNLGSYDIAVQDFSKIIQINPAFVAAYLNRAFCFIKSEQMENGKADYEKVLQLDPNNAIAIRQLQLLKELIKK